MKKIVIVIFVLSLLIFCVSLISYIRYISPLTESTYYARAAVTEDLGGFDVNSSALIFGSVPIGGSSTRSIIVNNSYPFEVKVKPEVEGNIREIISYSPLIVMPYESSQFRMSVSANATTRLGNYSGNITIGLYRA